jgi:hypothetical protein
VYRMLGYACLALSGYRRMLDRQPCLFLLEVWSPHSHVLSSCTLAVVFHDSFFCSESVISLLLNFCKNKSSWLCPAIV